MRALVQVAVEMAIGWLRGEEGEREEKRLGGGVEPVGGRWVSTYVMVKAGHTQISSVPDGERGRAKEETDQAEENSQHSVSQSGGSIRFTNMPCTWGGDANGMVASAHGTDPPSDMRQRPSCWILLPACPLSRVDRVDGFCRSPGLAQAHGNIYSCLPTLASTCHLPAIASRVFVLDNKGLVIRKAEDLQAIIQCLGTGTDSCRASTLSASRRCL